MKSRKRLLAALFSVTALLPLPTNAYVVFLHTGHGPLEVNRMFDKSTFPTVSDRSEEHGVWVFGLTLEPLNHDQGQMVAKNVGTKRPTAYAIGPYMIKDKAVDWFSEGEPSPTLNQYWNWGFEKPNFILFYREHSSDPAVETYIRPEDVEPLKKSIAATGDRKQRRALEDAKWLTLMRKWNPELEKSIALEEVGGVVAEFGIPVGGPLLIQNNLVPAIKYTLKQGKYIFLLTPPRNHADSSVENYYSDGYEEMVDELKSHLTRKEFASEKLVFVPANYAYGKDGKNVKVTPESNPNTVTGVNKWLIEKAK